MSVIANVTPSRAYVLISAHHCAPGMGSEHAVGWNLVSRIARTRPVLLITQDNEFSAAIRTGVQELREQGACIEVFYVHHGSRADGRRNSLRLGYYLSYRRYQARVLALARELITRYPICAVHQLTIVGFREPGLLWKLGLPFIWGPVGGLVFTPACLRSQLPWRSRLFAAVRESITWLQFHASPRVRGAYRAAQAGAFIAATPDIGERFVRRYGGRFEWIPEAGTHALPSELAPRVPAPRLRLLWAGALIDRKPLGLLLDAIALIPDHARRIELLVVGDGESRRRYEAQAVRLGIAARFVGWCSHADTQAHFDQADLFVLLSLLDLSTNVVFESLSRGLPVLCLDHHGYARIVDDSCGIKVPVDRPEVVRAAIAQQLKSMDAGRLAALAQGALKRASQFSWDLHAQRIAAHYPA